MKGKKRKPEADVTGILRLAPVVLFTCVVPLLLHVMPYTLPLGRYDWIATEDDTVLWDVFSCVKLAAMAVIAGISVLIFLFLIIKKQIRIRRSPVYIPMAGYTLAVLLSFAVSEHKDVAWLGGMNRFEGTLAILCYMVMLFYTIQAVDGTGEVLVILRALGITVFIECLIGLTQLAGHDILFSEAVKRIIAGDMEINPVFEPGQVYQTVANMDYVPFWLCLVIPLIVLTAAKGIRELLLVLIAVNCYGAGSAGGLAGIALSLVLLAVMYLPDKRLRIISCAAAAVVFCGLVIFLYERSPDPMSIDYFETGRDSFETSVDGRPLSFAYDDNGILHVKGEDGQDKELEKLFEDDSLFQIKDPDFGEKITILPFMREGESYVMLEMLETQFLFHFAHDGVTFCNPYGYEVTLQKDGSGGRIGFDRHLGFANGRGYIWACSLPLIGRHLFLGSGADTFMLVFPQKDYAGKVTSGGAVSTIVDKAHSLYVQMAVTTGAVSLIAFISMIIVSYVSAWRKYFRGTTESGGSRKKAAAVKGREKKGRVVPAGIRESADPGKTIVTGIMTGMAGFLVSALVCDSTVSVMPVFYGLLGILISLGSKEGL